MSAPSGLIHDQTLGYVTFSGAAFAEITDMKWGGVSCQQFEVTNADTTIEAENGGGVGSKQFFPSSVVNPGDFTIQALFNPNIAPHVGRVASMTVTVGSGGARFIGSACISDFSADMPLDGKVMTCTFRLKWQGTVQIIAGS